MHCRPPLLDSKCIKLSLKAVCWHQADSVAKQININININVVFFWAKHLVFHCQHSSTQEIPQIASLAPRAKCIANALYGLVAESDGLIQPTIIALDLFEYTNKDQLQNDLRWFQWKRD